MKHGTRFDKKSGDPENHSEKPGGLRGGDRMRCGQGHQNQKDKSQTLEPEGDLAFRFDSRQIIEFFEKVLHQFGNFDIFTFRKVV